MGSNFLGKKEGVVCNYKVWYESDQTWGHHLLKISEYAKSAKERKLDSWVLVHTREN